MIGNSTIFVKQLLVVALLGGGFLVGGCMVGSDYVRPDTSAQLPTDFKVPVGWKVAEPSDREARGAWWRRFGDAELNRLMERVGRENFSVRAAYFRVEQARSAVSLGRGELEPRLNFDPSVERRRSSGNTQSGNASFSGSSSTRIDLPLVFGYELDLWGRLRRGLQAAEAEAAASEEEYHNVLLSLQGDLATAYLSARAIDREIEILGEGLGLRPKSLELNRKRFKVGDIDEVDVSRAETEVSATEAEILGLRKDRAELEDLVALLVGVPSSDFRLAAAPLTGAPPRVPGTVPSALLERRPDIARAERTMQAANGRMGAAEAALYPTVSLSAGLGLAGSDVGRVLRSDSRTWELIPAASVPLLDGGRRKVELERSGFRYQETVAEYRQSILNAVREVDDALTAISLVNQQAAAQGRTVVSARRTVELSQKRYDAGLVAYFDVVDAQRTALEAERTAARIDGARHLATVALIKAVGGDL
ncbi:MAG: efflux transporter outer membrane subunit [Verrucomicrobia bacterium]|nr:efflux transporter outer membrane subunit [Verrucomicrobiota bacterium]MDA1005954.1 efflux transporter outer membrane subunit [Verrucomicrobiota bacterium]